ncbi:MAG: outer membrane protein assembly factor BamD [Pseudomonadota bacterium]
MVRAFSLFSLFLSSLMLNACGSFGREDAEDRFAYVEEPIEVLYAKATDALDRKRYEEAILYFEEVERQHPYSAWARRSMLMTAYTQYLTNDYEDSLATIERFLSIHPGNKSAAYAYYLKAINHYERIRDVGRDQDITQNALTALQDVVRRYPDTEYARDARLKLDLTQDHLAGKEMDVGRYYLRQNQHIAAINRFNTVLTSYQTTSHVPEALHRIVEAYLQLGVVPEARRHAAVLGHNYPGSDWYRDTYRLFKSRGLERDAAVETSDASGVTNDATAAVN